MHTLTSSQLRELASGLDAANLSSDARERLNWIIFFVEHHHSVSETCVHLGISRSTFHRWLERFDPRDLSTLEEKSHVPLTPRMPGVSADAVTLIRAYRQTNPNMGKEKIHTLLQEEHGITISSSTVGRVIERECLYFAATPLHWKKRTNKTEDATDTSDTAEAAPVIIVQSTPVHHVTSKKKNAWKRALITASVLVNLTIGALAAATLTWESHSATAELTNANAGQTSVISSLDKP